MSIVRIIFLAHDAFNYYCTYLFIYHRSQAQIGYLKRRISRDLHFYFDDLWDCQPQRLPIEFYVLLDHLLPSLWKHYLHYEPYALCTWSLWYKYRFQFRQGRLSTFSPSLSVHQLLVPYFMLNFIVQIWRQKPNLHLYYLLCLPLVDVFF